MQFSDEINLQILCKTIIINTILLFSIPIEGVITRKVNQEPEWYVEVGESRTYIFTKVFSLSESNPNKIVDLVANDRQELITIVLEEGTTVTYTVTEIPKIGIVMGKRTINNSIVLKEEIITYIVRRTVPDKAYWEEYYKNETSIHLIGDIIIETKTQIDNDLIVQESRYQIAGYQIGVQGLINVTELVKWEWMTGWQTHFHSRFYNETSVFRENEYELIREKPFDQKTNMIFGLSLLLVIIGTLVGIKIYKDHFRIT